MPDPVYLDHAATTPVRAEVLEAMLPYFGPRFGNPSSVHRWGREARTALDEARERLARCLGATSDEVVFTSCGTEADNMAVIGVWRARRSSGRRAVVTTPIEHKAVLAAAHEVAKEGGEERLLAMQAGGLVDEGSFDALVTDAVAVCSVMWVNNEIGVLQDVASLAARSKARGVVFHTDAVQAFGKVEVDARTTPFDVLSISGHKIGAPKGIGALFIRRGTPMEPRMFGGSQDRGRRPGTENVAMAIGLARAAELAVAERAHEWATLEAQRDRLEEAILARIPDAVIHGRGSPRAPHITNVSVPGVDSESMLMALDLRGVACSAGSACQSGSITPSHVLSALGVPAELAGAAIRMSLGALTTDAGIDRVAELFPSLVEKARRLAPA
ncbi:MAG TPA: cysteine desulfurase family protein [Gemmatimonadaceae bacterium]|nr:cysteine desulfurase family protein [Gemmatimonadaceae bacterium]